MKTQNTPALRIIALAAFFASCASVKDSHFQTQFAKSSCAPPISLNYTQEDFPKPLHEIEIDSSLKESFTFQSLNTANAHGLIYLLAEFMELKGDYKKAPTLEKKVNLIEIIQKVNERINIASLEISAVAGEIDCEEERTDQVATYLKGKENRIESRLTIAAIVIGAAGTIIDGILLTSNSKSHLADEVGIGIGLTEATLGLLILKNKKTIEFHHPRNLLHDIWKAPATSTLFPPSVWYYLTYESPGQSSKSIRNQLLENWQEFGQILNDPKHKVKLDNLFFGEGGEYKSEQLKNRADMYDQLESQIKLMKQNLTVLTIEFEAISRL